MNRFVRPDRPTVNWMTVHTVRRGDVVVEITQSDQERPRYSYSISFWIFDPRQGEKSVRSRQPRWEGRGADLRIANRLVFADLTSAVVAAEDYIEQRIREDDRMAAPRFSRRRDDYGRDD